ncbi:MAG TPA: hypothetical protein VH415_01430 [Nitrososphaeraceae archaeon]|jgi:hypothetical protein
MNKESVRHKMPREMAEVLDKIVKKYGKKQGINNRNELITSILSAFLAGAAEEDNGNNHLDRSRPA